MPARGHYIDLTGQRFGRLVCLEYAGADKRRVSLWRCTCDCGNETIIRGTDLTRKRGAVQSCGCLQREKLAENRPKDYHTINIKHGWRHHRLYNIYNNMKQRCYNENTPCYKWYGGKGVRICDEWLASVDAFASWAMQNGYSDDLTIDRIDSGKDYSPENCRWITHGDNARRAAIKQHQSKEKSVTTIL